MVYRKGTLKVLLGPEHLHEGDDDQCAFDTHESHVVQIKPQPRKHIEPFHTFGKIGETNVYKRTRPFLPVQPRPRLDRYPSGLELAGQKVDKEEDKSKSARSVRSTLSTRSGAQAGEQLDTQPTDNSNKSDEMDGKSQTVKDIDGQTHKGNDGGFKSPLQKPKTGRLSANNSVSKYFLTDFGFRSERTDTFSGHHRHRGVASAEIERQMEEKAEKHIRTCQLMGNVKRSCKAQLGYQGLRHAVSPRQSLNTIYSPDARTHGSLSQRDFFRSAENVSKDNSVPYMIQIRKSLGSISKTRAIGHTYQRPESLPKVTCRTLMVGSGLGV